MSDLQLPKDFDPKKARACLEEKEDVIGTFVKGFTKFQENEQLKRAKETRGDLEKMNTPTLVWLRNTTDDILEKRKAEEWNRPLGKDVKCPRCGKMHHIIVQPVFFGDQTICKDCSKNKAYIGKVTR